MNKVLKSTEFEKKDERSRNEFKLILLYDKDNRDSRDENPLFTFLEYPNSEFINGFYFGTTNARTYLII